LQPSAVRLSGSGVGGSYGVGDREREVLFAALMADVIPLPKVQLREETSELVDRYLADGGTVNTRPGQRVQVRCNRCAMAFMVATSRATQYKQYCYRCHSPDVEVSW
jgi:hypothetical protein